MPPQDLRITLNGRNVNTCKNVSILPGDVFRVQTFLPGGKGGFGSMLRAIGAQIEKTTNREACRDLSGRRMRDVNDEKKYVVVLRVLASISCQFPFSFIVTKKLI